MPKTSNTTHCLICAAPLVKNGKTTAGTQRWRCPNCGSSSTRKRPDVTRKHQLGEFLSWLLGKRSQAEMTDTKTGRSLRRNTAWCWDITPSLPAVTEPPRVVLLDGTYLGGWCLLVAITEDLTPLAWQWCARESEAAWAALLRQIPAPLVVVCDGGSGLHAALRGEWPDTLIQRCIFHVWLNLRTHLTLQPRTPAGQSLLKIGKLLRRITTTNEATAWLQQLNDWFLVYEPLIKERTYAKRRADGSWESATGKRWWYTHERLRRGYHSMQRLARAGHLFTYLEVGCERTTSRLEGGINSVIKEALRIHRGMSEPHQRRAAEWILLDRAGLLHTAHTFPAESPARTAKNRRPRFTEPDPGPALYDTGLTAEEGLWLRDGWAGRA